MSTKSIGTSQQETARGFAAKVNEATIVTFKTVTEHGEKAKAGPFASMLALRANFGAEVMSSWPVPGTEAEKGHNNPDRFLVIRTVNKVDKQVKSSFYNEMNEALEYVKGMRAEIAAIKLIDNENADPAKIDADLKRKYPLQQQRDTRVTVLESRINYSATLLRKGAALFHKLADVSGMPKIDVVVLYEDKEKTAVQNTNQPIIVWENNEEGKGVDHKYFSISSFLKIDVEKAMAAGGTLADIRATLKRDDTDETEQGFVGTIKNVEEAKLTFAEIHRYLNSIMGDGTKDQSAYEALLTQINARKKDKEFVAALVETMVFLQQLDQRTGIGKIYNSFDDTMKTVEKAA